MVPRNDDIHREVFLVKRSDLLDGVLPLEILDGQQQVVSQAPDGKMLLCHKLQSNPYLGLISEQTLDLQQAVGFHSVELGCGLEEQLKL